MYVKNFKQFYQNEYHFSIDQLKKNAQKSAEKPNKIIFFMEKWAWVKPH
jgi:hypothetical protein